MTRDEFLFLLQTEKPYEFEFCGKKYNITYDRDSSGKTWIVFGRLYEGKRYASYGELMNNAKVENHFFREILPDLEIS